MQKSPYLPFLLLLNTLSWGEYTGIANGILDSQSQFTSDSASLEESTYLGELNMQTYRRHDIGWMARGPRLEIQQSPNHLSVDAHVSMYQFHTHQGVWFQFQWQDTSMATEISSNQVYVSESGAVQGLTTGDTIAFERHLHRGHIYWYESVKDEGPINTLGLFYASESAPVNASISSTNASLFDGVFSGFGFTLGRIKDDRGLNFQWQMYLAKLDSDLSNNAIQHRQLSKAESTVYQMEIRLDWHYRYYLSPYWYVVPSLHVNYERLMQTQFEPEFIEHDAFSLMQLSGFIALRRYF